MDAIMHLIGHLFIHTYVHTYINILFLFSFTGYRVQFLAIEIARNREGLNSDLRFTQNKKPDTTEQSGNS